MSTQHPAPAGVIAKPLRVLLVEDSPHDAELLLVDLERSGYDVTSVCVQTADAMKAALDGSTWDVVVSDYCLPTFDGMSALATLKATGQDIPFIIVSGTIDEENAVSALKAGAHDFLVKGSFARLAPTIERELREVSERRARVRAQQALHQSEARLRSLVEHAVFGICQATLEGTFLAVNPALVTMLGHTSADDLITVGLADLFLDASAGKDFLQRLHSLRPQFTGEEAMWRQKTGEPVRVRLSGRVATLSGSPILEAIVEDITERHRLEEQLRQAQKMEGLGRLAGGIAHDFNNMLTAIMGYSDMMLEHVGKDDTIGADLLEIRGAADRAAGLTRQLLAFSRQQELDIGPVEVNAVIEGIRAMLQRLIGQDIAIELALTGHLRPILADRVQLEQILMNIAANARDAMPGGGRLSIRTSSARADEVTAVTGVSVPAGQYVTLELSDSGSGMDARTREKIFDPFFTTKEVGKGTGLGLATVYGIVKQLNGYICVSSEVGRGSTFTMFFPESARYLETTPGSVDPEVSPSPPASQPLVLVVEDEAGLRKLVLRTLTRHGYRVLEASTPQIALTLAAQHGQELDLVISDVVMPVMNGPEMVKRLRKDGITAKVLYTSGYTGGAMSREDTIDAESFLGKPFTGNDLLLAVRDLLSTSQDRGKPV